MSDRLSLDAYLLRHGIDAEIITPGQPTPTVETAARALGVHTDQIIKSLVFEDRSGRSVIAIARGTQPVDAAKVAAAAGLGKLRMASRDRVLEITGYEAGGAPPVGHRTSMPVILDRAVLDQPVVYGGGGRIELLLRIRTADIVRLTNAIVATITANTGDER